MKQIKQYQVSHDENVCPDSLSTGERSGSVEYNVLQDHPEVIDILEKRVKL